MPSTDQTFAALRRHWWCLYMSEKFSSGTKISKKKIIWSEILVIRKKNEQLTYVESDDEWIQNKNISLHSILLLLNWSFFCKSNEPQRNQICNRRWLIWGNKHGEIDLSTCLCVWYVNTSNLINRLKQDINELRKCIRIEYVPGTSRLPLNGWNIADTA